MAKNKYPSRIESDIESFDLKKEKPESTKQTDVIKASVKEKEKTVKEANTKVSETEPKNEAVQQTVQRKAGRPKIFNEHKTRITFYLSDSIKEEMESFMPAFRGGASGYLEKLIKNDLEQNRKKYAEIVKMIG